MTDTALNSKKEEKFFFNVNNFDDPEDNNGEEELPPPVFSEEDLKAAKQKAFQDGRQEGTTETRQNQEANIKKTLEKISADLALLLQAEHKREKIYEHEVIETAIQIFQKLFPAYNKKHGFEELKEAIATTLKKQEGQTQITISVSPETVDGIKDQLSQIESTETSNKLIVKSDDSLAQGACALSWADGGAVRDPAALAEEIQSLLQQPLAGTPTKGHDGNIEQEVSENNEAVENQETDKNAEPKVEHNEDIMEKPDE